MRKLVAFENVTLDGVMQAPGRPDEDRRGGFEHGGWAAPYADQVTADLAAQGAQSSDALLLGRFTYESMHAFWPTQPDNPFSKMLAATHKYVASRTLQPPLPWEHSELLLDDAAASVAMLKLEPGKDIVILGSGELVRSLMQRDLVDEFILLIHPLILGSGRRLFEDGGAPADLRLVESRTSTTGVEIATYRRADGTRSQAA